MNPLAQGMGEMQQDVMQSQRADNFNAKLFAFEKTMRENKAASDQIYEAAVYQVGPDFKGIVPKPRKEEAWDKYMEEVSAVANKVNQYRALQKKVKEAGIDVDISIAHPNNNLALKDYDVHIEKLQKDVDDAIAAKHVQTVSSALQGGMGVATRPEERVEVSPEEWSQRRIRTKYTGATGAGKPKAQPTQRTFYGAMGAEYPEEVASKAAEAAAKGFERPIEPSDYLRAETSGQVKPQLKSATEYFSTYASLNEREDKKITERDKAKKDFEAAKAEYDSFDPAIIGEGEHKKLMKNLGKEFNTSLEAAKASYDAAKTALDTKSKEANAASTAKQGFVKTALKEGVDLEGGTPSETGVVVRPGPSKARIPGGGMMQSAETQAKLRALREKLSDPNISPDLKTRIRNKLAEYGER